MECTVIKGSNLQVKVEVDTDTGSIRIRRRIGLLEPAFITESNKMIGVERLDVCRNGRCPLVNGSTGGDASRRS